jgi:hypothetical protein
VAALAVFGTSVPAVAEVYWSDYFNDGDYEGWTVLEGSFTVPSSPKHCLRAGSGSMNMIYHPSIQTNGTWLFEMYEDGNEERSIEVLFMATGMQPEEFEGYSIWLVYNPTEYGITFSRWNYSSYFEHSARCILYRHQLWTEEMDLPEPAWHTFNITRTADGDILVSRDSEQIVTSTPETLEWEFDDVFNVSDKLVIRAHRYAMVDSICVGTDLPPLDTSEPSTSSTTTPATSTQAPTTDTSSSSATSTTTSGQQSLLNPATLGLLLGGSVVVAIVVIVMHPRRR